MERPTPFFAYRAKKSLHIEPNGRGSEATEAIYCLHGKKASSQVGEGERAKRPGPFIAFEAEKKFIPGYVHIGCQIIRAKRVSNCYMQEKNN